MAKAIKGAEMLGAAVAVGAAIYLSGGTLAPALGPLMTSLVMSGISMEAGAIADALSSNRGTSITTRQPAANRQIVYGERRIGGVTIYQSTTGSHHDQYNYVIVLAGHQIDSIVNLYLDGRQVHWQGSGPGWSVRNGVGFGGNADHNSYRDQGNNRYNFGTLVYCEARYGDQLPGDVIAGLTANDPTWAASAQGSPYVGGCAYVYLKVEFDTAMFPQAPEIKFTIRGKNDILDPRTRQRGFTNNWALCVADVLTNGEFGVGENPANINTQQLIAAANVCDQQIPLANGQTEAQYTCNAVFDTAVSPGAMLDTMMPAAQGRLSYIGGQWYVWPAYWQGPSLSFNESHLLKGFSWTEARPLRERYNRVKGSFIAADFPWNVAGNLYDGNGFFDNTRQDNFNGAFMRTDAPYFACDPLHGYASDQYLAEDNNKERWLDIQHQCVTSLGQAQRTFKIALLRNRLGAGKATLTMSLAAYAAQPLDVIQFTYPKFGWTNKLLEVVGVRFRVEAANEGEAPALMVDLDVQETDPSIYTWTTREELSVTEQPASLQMYSYQVQAPSNLAMTDGVSTAVITPDGVTRPRLSVSWVAAPDIFVTQYQIQIQLAGSSTWLDAGLVDAANTATYLDNVVSGQTYNVRVRSLTPRGAASSWTESDGHMMGAAYSQVNSLGLAPGLIATSPNTATVDSVLSGSTATVRVYGPGGVGTNYTLYLGSTAITVPGASFTGQPTSKTLYVFWNASTSVYTITAGTTPSDNSVFIGSVTTVSSTGTGGTSGGGGTYACTKRGTVLISDLGAESNESIYQRFIAGEDVCLQGRHGLERVVHLEWVPVDHQQMIAVDGFEPFYCSDTHTVLAEGEAGHRWCSVILSGTRVDTIRGMQVMTRTQIDEPCDVLKIELAGPDHEYLCVDGVWSHNAKPLTSN